MSAQHWDSGRLVHAGAFDIYGAGIALPRASIAEPNALVDGMAIDEGIYPKVLSYLVARGGARGGEKAGKGGQFSRRLFNTPKCVEACHVQT